MAKTRKTDNAQGQSKAARKRKRSSTKEQGKRTATHVEAEPLIPQPKGSATVHIDEKDDQIEAQLTKNEEILGLKEDQAADRIIQEFDGDSADSDDEETLLRIGNIPQHWYENYAEGEGLVGYSVTGEAIKKAPELQRDELDEFLRRQNDPNWWRELSDRLNNKNVKLTREDVELIERIRSGRLPFKEDEIKLEYPKDNTIEIHAISDYNPKRRYVRSLYERKMVNTYLQAIRRGWLKVRTRKEILKEYRQKFKKVWDIWKNESVVAYRNSRLPKQIEAPKRDLPSHAESYNPSKEYLLTKEEQAEQNDLDPEDKLYNFEPKAFDCLRRVPLYQNLIKENFERLLDLYICPRVQKKKINIAASSLIPDMPNPSELKPFPSKIAVEYKGHDDSKVRSLSVSPCGRYLASGDEAGNLFLWDAQTGRIRHKYKFEGVIDCVRFNPNPNVCVLAVVNMNHTYILVPQKINTKKQVKETESLIREFKSRFVPVIDTVSNKVPMAKWNFLENTDEDYLTRDIRVSIQFAHILKKLVWHSKGDYFSTLADNIQTSTQVLIHSLSKAQTQKPFSKSKGIIEALCFHPTKPYFYVCNDQIIFCYNLQKQILLKKYHSGARMVSSIAVHPKGEHFVIGSYDKKLMWFDAEIIHAPFKKMKYHQKAIRNVAFSQNYPLFASASDDGSLNVFHGQVYEDVLMNPLIVPVKILNGHGVRDRLGVLDCVFHPSQPWLFSAGADGRLIMWV